MRSMKSIYLRETTISKADLNTLMSNEQDLTLKQAIKHGFIESSIGVAIKRQRAIEANLPSNPAKKTVVRTTFAPFPPTTTLLPGKARITKPAKAVH